MKKYIFLPLAALALGFAACEDDENLGIPVVNPELDPVAATDVKVVEKPDMPVISLDAYNDSEQDIPVADIVPGDVWPEGFDFEAIAQVSTDEAFTNPVEIPAYINGTAILLNPDEVQGVIFNNFTHDPSNIDIYVRYGIYAVQGTLRVRLGDANTFYGAQKITVTPMNFATIEPVYYLIYSNDAETWTKENSIASTRGTKSQYDDPNFTFMCNFTAEQFGDGLYWKIIPESTYQSFDLANGLVIGVTEKDSESRSGKLDESADQLAGYLDISGRVMFEINLDRVIAVCGSDAEKGNAMTFSYKEAIENFWLAGDNVNGLSWSFAAEPTMWTNDYLTYVGMAVLGSQFKFSPSNAWGGDFGSDKGLEFSTNDGGELIGTGAAVGSANINVAEPGLYYISLDYASKALQLVKIDSWGIIGGFNGWDSSVEMTKVDDFTYTITADMHQGDEWKIRANNAWTVSLGGQFDNLSPFNGANFKCDADGTYDITLNIRNIPWTAKVVKK